MGYITWFTLQTYGNADKIAAMEKDAETYPDEAISDLVKEECLEAKWYDFDDDFKKFAKRHPDVLFVVSGDGENSDDLWEARFKGEEYEAHSVEMPPFTNPKLKIPLKSIK